MGRNAQPSFTQQVEGSRQKLRAFTCLWAERSAKLHCGFVNKGQWRNLQVLRSRALTNASCVVVMGSMARAKVAAPIASIRLWDATKMRANANADQPFWILATIRICLRIAHGSHEYVVLLRRCNRFWSSAANKDRLAPPLHDEVLTNLNG